MSRPVNREEEIEDLTEDIEDFIVATEGEGDSSALAEHLYDRGWQWVD